MRDPRGKLNDDREFNAASRASVLQSGLVYANVTNSRNAGKENHVTP